MQKSSLATSKNQRSNPVDGSPEKLRILCLHGYRQTGDVFKAKIGSFRKLANKYAEFVFITAPHKVTIPAPVADSSSKSGDSADDDGKNSKSSGGDDSESTEVDNQRSWWSNKDDGTFKGTNKNGPAFGFDVSLRVVEEAWQALGPFHGLLGFSQGACFVGLLCNLSTRGMTPIKPQFAIMAAGFRSGSLAHLNYYGEEIGIPSLHIYGQGDTIIPAEMSEMLACAFDGPQVVQHSGGHYFAASPKEKGIYIDFLRDRLVEYLENKELEREDATTAVIGGTSNASITTSDDSD